jgi:hypothetical protein
MLAYFWIEESKDYAGDTMHMHIEADISISVASLSAWRMICTF